MDGHTIPASPSDMNAKYENAIRVKLDALMRANHYSQIQFNDMLRERGLDLGQGNLSSILKGRRRIPLSLIVHICDIFKLSLAELVDENFGGAKQVSGVYSDDLMQLTPYLGDNFVIDPHDPHFSGYLQTYHVYLFPSQGDDLRVRTGKLHLRANNHVCEAVLEINTNKTRLGQPYIKRYEGRCFISTTMRSVFILLADREKGEFSVLNFRYHSLSTYPLDCRIACALLNATGVEHPPTMQRMFLSRTEIAAEHIPLLQTHLYLNNSITPIRKEQLESLADADGYRRVIDELFRTNQPQCVYYLDEDDVLSAARRCLGADGHPLRHPEDPQVTRFLADLRTISEHSRFNKASRQADHLSRRLLRSLGYFHDHEYDN
jgi:hypothetical protein